MTEPPEAEPAHRSPAPPPHPAPAPPVHPAPPFAPVMRVPWVNPQRRGHLAGVAAVAGLVLLGAGFGIGYAAAPSGHHHDGIRIERGYPPGKLIGPYGRRPDRVIPGGPRLRPTPAPTSPSGTPSPSSTG